jgi:hypothetical protein
LPSAPLRSCQRNRPRTYEPDNSIDFVLAVEIGETARESRLHADLGCRRPIGVSGDQHINEVGKDVGNCLGYWRRLFKLCRPLLPILHPSPPFGVPAFTQRDLPSLPLAFSQDQFCRVGSGLAKLFMARDN